MRRFTTITVIVLMAVIVGAAFLQLVVIPLASQHRGLSPRGLPERAQRTQ